MDYDSTTFDEERILDAASLLCIASNHKTINSRHIMFAIRILCHTNSGQLIMSGTDLIMKYSCGESSNEDYKIKINRLKKQYDFNPTHKKYKQFVSSKNLNLSPFASIFIIGAKEYFKNHNCQTNDHLNIVEHLVRSTFYVTNCCRRRKITIDDVIVATDILKWLPHSFEGLQILTNEEFINKIQDNTSNFMLGSGLLQKINNTILELNKL